MGKLFLLTDPEKMELAFIDGKGGRLPLQDSLTFASANICQSCTEEPNAAVLTDLPSVKVKS